MLDPEIPEERREQIASEARSRIESGGSLKHDNAWGMRKLAYEIRQRTEADYRLFRFETGGELLAELNHNLRIADGVLRFRIFKVDPGSPAIVPPAPLATGAAAPSRGSRRPQGGDAREAREPAPAEEAAPEGEPAPEPAGAEAEGSPEAGDEPAGAEASASDTEESPEAGDQTAAESPADQDPEPQAAE
jgi:small subunit ribosomal protein S6